MQYDDIVLCATEWKTCHTVYCGGTTMEQFAEYLKTMLIPALSKTDIIVKCYNKVVTEVANKI